MFIGGLSWETDEGKAAIREYSIVMSTCARLTLHVRVRVYAVSHVMLSYSLHECLFPAFRGTRRLRRDAGPFTTPRNEA